MKTEISQFCQDYAKILNPFQATLRESVGAIEDKEDADALKKPLSGLSDVQHRLQTLVDKVEDQQAYVIIFGPLKSGKSTLMNAISSSYVSEVTSLPAYPCLVYVKHDEETRFVATQFNGRQQTFQDSRQMQEGITEAHQQLAREVRQTEEKGETFDPGLHLPQAIRRLDISLPADNLKDSYTVLVDTPGLYSRMKFGYDLMTREFRDSAACAVFVVKTDNLFLEQVFAEFNELLNLFSRIFLVVNIDRNKRDLGPDGSLRPSLESSDPKKIVDAFCSLSMSAPLRNAFDEGKLKIYPIDLLQAASDSLRGPTGETGETDPVEEREEEDGTAVQPVVETTPPGVSFPEFLTDLTDYLNSSDYLINFMRDSMRQGQTLARESKEHCSAESLKPFHERQASLEYQQKEERARREAVSQLQALDWGEAFGRMRKDCRESGVTLATAEENGLKEAIRQQVDEWFASDEGLRGLIEERVAPLFAQAAERAEQGIREAVEGKINTSLGGVELSPELIRSLDKVGLSLLNIQSATKASELNVETSLLQTEINVPVKSLPVKKSFWDWLFFQTMGKVRKRVLGDEKPPAKPIPAAVKAKRLGEPVKEALLTEMDTLVNRVYPDSPVEVMEGVLRTYEENFRAGIDRELEKAAADLDQKLPRLEARIRSNEGILRALERLKNSASKVEYAVVELEQKVAQLHPAVTMEIEEG